MALIPMDPEPRPHRLSCIGMYALFVLLTIAIGATGGLLDQWGQP